MNVLKALRKTHTWRDGISMSVAILLVLASAVAALAAGSGPAPDQLVTFSSPLTSTPTPTSTSEASPIDTPTFTPTPTHTSTYASTPTDTPTHTPRFTPIHTSTPTARPSPTFTQPPPSITPGPGGFYYTVRPGDNLFRIALRFGTTIQAIVQANGIVNSRLIRVGQVLWIPSSGSGPVNPTIYIVQWGDTLYSIARRFGTTWQALAAINGLRNPSLLYVGQRLIIPGSVSPGPTPTPPSQQIYIVRSGDTLWAIALRFGTTPWAIAVANGLRNPNLIYPGQRLIIP